MNLRADKIHGFNLRISGAAKGKKRSLGKFYHWMIHRHIKAKPSVENIISPHTRDTTKEEIVNNTERVQSWINTSQHLCKVIAPSFPQSTVRYHNNISVQNNFCSRYTVKPVNTFSNGILSNIITNNNDIIQPEQIGITETNQEMHEQESVSTIDSITNLSGITTGQNHCRNDDKFSSSKSINDSRNSVLEQQQSENSREQVIIAEMQQSNHIVDNERVRILNENRKKVKAISNNGK